MTLIPSFSAPPVETARLPESDLRLINALAAYQLRYGHAEEAFLLAQLAHHYDTKNVQTLMIMARALAALGDWTSADALAHAVVKLRPPGLFPRADMLFCAIAAFANSQLDRMRELLAHLFAAAQTGASSWKR
jgi:hypothetical protein